MVKQTELWQEYDKAAIHCAKRLLADKRWDSLPENLSAGAFALITDDIEAFEKYVRTFAYAISMGEEYDE